MNTHVLGNLFPLTQNQTSIWLDNLLAKDDTIYVIVGCAEIKQTLDLEAFQKALQKVVAESDAFGISIHVDDDQPYQRFTPQENYKLPILDFSEKSNAEGHCKSWITQRLKVPFTLEQSPLYEFALLKAAERHYFWMLKIHHLLIDNWSFSVFAKKMDSYYTQFLDGALAPNGQIIPRFASYLPTEQAYQNSTAQENDKNYWLRKFNRLPERLLEKRALKDTIDKKLEQTWRIPTTLQAEIENAAKQLNVSLSQFWMGVIATYFYRTTNQTDLCFGLPVANRDTEEAQNTVGLYIGVLPLTVKISASLTFEELLQQISNTRRSDRPHQRLSLMELLSELRKVHQTDTSLFDISINFLNVRCSLENLNTEIIWWKRGGEGKLPMTFFIVPRKANQQWELTIAFLPEYSTLLEVERILQRLEVLVKSVIQNHQQALAYLDLLPQAERHLLLHTFNDTQTDYQKDKTIIQLFEEQVEKTPDHIALVFDPQDGRQAVSLTYQQLNERANQLGHYLREKYAIQADDIIALQLERSEWMVVAILGVLKSGAAYLPIDPDFPLERVQYMLEDSQAKVLLQDKSTFGKQAFSTPTEQIVNIQQSTHANPSLINSPDDLAYIIYTSGSTGKPKGVMIEHSAILNTILHQNRLLDISSTDKILNFANYTFDASVWEILTALMNGASIVISTNETIKQTNQFSKIIKEHQIGIVLLPPFFLSLMKKNDLSLLKILISGGDPALAADLVHYSNNMRCFNAFGPTESSVYVSIFEIKNDFKDSVVPIGQPTPNTEIFIIDTQNNIQPIGIAGELCIGGAGLARGYLNNPELTSEKFIAHPFKEGERLYKTGDLARWLPDGNVEFLGRIDHQLKIRGYRIEAGEIEQVLLQHPNIQSAVVMGQETKSGKELVAYLVSSQTGMPGLEELRTHLSKQLPDYMIPSYFVSLDNLPLTTSGKVNRAALPLPDTTHLTNSSLYVAPRNSTEAALVKIWEEVLQREGVGVYDNFFELGGHSLKAIRVVALVQKRLNIHMALSEIFAHPSIAELTEKVYQNSSLNLIQDILGTAGKDSESYTIEI